MGFHQQDINLKCRIIATDRHVINTNMLPNQKIV
jgi:hypothetical protein